MPAFSSIHDVFYSSLRGRRRKEREKGSTGAKHEERARSARRECIARQGESARRE